MNNERVDAFVRFARRVAEEEAVWADWHNRVFGVDGEFSKLFPTEEERAEFVESPRYSEIERISAALREGTQISEYTVPVTTSTASGKFVVRVPKSLHEQLVSEARREGVSMNQLVLYLLSVNLRTASRELIEKRMREMSEN